MNLRRAFEHIQASLYEDRTKDWPPEHCIACPRKGGQIANDRCLEYQAADHCVCPDAATTSVRAELDDEEEAREAKRAVRTRSAPC